MAVYILIDVSLLVFQGVVEAGMTVLLSLKVGGHLFLEVRAENHATSWAGTLTGALGEVEEPVQAEEEEEATKVLSLFT